MTIFLRLLDVAVDEKADTMLRSVRSGAERWFDVEPTAFAQVPGSPFAYWISERLRSAFQLHGRLENSTRVARQGGVTGDDFRWLRLWHEAPPLGGTPGIIYAPMAKGGKFSPFFADLLLCVRWDNSRNTFHSFTGLPHRPSLQPASFSFYFRPGVTWPLRTNGLSFRAMPTGCAFGHKGPSAFLAGDSATELLALCALMNSSPYGFLVGVQLARTELAQSYEVGLIQQTPVPAISAASTSELASLALRAWSLKRTLDMVKETSRAFVLPAALRSSPTTLGSFDASTIEAELAEIQAAIDELSFRAYEFEGEDRATIESWAAKARNSNADLGEGDEDGDEAEEVDSADTAAALHSWAVGVAFGRFDLRLATGEREAPLEPEPFDPLPTRSPGMIPEPDEVEFPARPMLVDDLGHAFDLTAQVGGVLERVGFAPENPETLRRWLARDFFPLHIKMYSRSRRKAPIYWQLATPSASYSVWLYIHAYTGDTLYNVQETTETKLRHEERKLDSLRTNLGPNPKAAERKALAARETFVEELRTFLDEVKRVAPLWSPDLDDGVIINFAPLWRLVPHHKPWQKELKTTWSALCGGEYDWAHLAMHLWPERVVPKCVTDRSLAIAHGLEEVFWEESQAGKWKPQRVPTRPLEELVQERTSQAAKTALKSLLDAPVNGLKGRRGRPKSMLRGSGEEV